MRELLMGSGWSLRHLAFGVGVLLAAYLLDRGIDVWRHRHDAPTATDRLRQLNERFTRGDSV